MADNIDIKWAVTDIKYRSDAIGLYRRYYDGDHRMPWATPRWRNAYMELFGRFRDNLCPSIVDAKADRLQISSVMHGSENDPVNDILEAMWEREEMERRQGEVHKNALKDGDAFVIIWPDNASQARWYVQRGDRVAAKYREDPQGEIEKAAKLWPVDDYEATDGKCYWRLNLYYTDRIERYVTTERVVAGDVPDGPNKWEEWMPAIVEGEEDDDEGRTEPGPIVPNPYGVVPVFPFPNNADLGAYGRSELRDVIPLQDALNKSVANMLVGGEFVAWPQRYFIGLEVDVDEEGNPTGREQRQALDSVFAIANENAKAGEFSGANLSSFIAEQDSYRAEMARVSRTPLHYLLLTGDFPSGEALGAAERPLASQIDDRIMSLKPAWAKAASFALTVEQVEHNLASINVQYKDTRYKSPESTAEDLRLKKELGIPDEQLWREMGYDQAQIEEFTAAKEERALAMQAAFNAGTANVINPEAEPGGPLQAVS